MFIEITFKTREVFFLAILVLGSALGVGVLKFTVAAYA